MHPFTIKSLLGLPDEGPRSTSPASTIQLSDDDSRAPSPTGTITLSSDDEEVGETLKLLKRCDLLLFKTIRLFRFMKNSSEGLGVSVIIRMNLKIRMMNPEHPASVLNMMTPLS